MKKFTMRCTAVVALCSCLYRCTTILSANPSGGGGSETVNAQVAVAGYSVSVIVRADTVRTIDIGLFSAAFNPAADTGFSYSQTIRDSLGGISLDLLDAGRYQVLVRDSLSGRATLLRDIVIPVSLPDTLLDTLCATASVSGIVVTREKITPNSLAALVPGTLLWTIADTSGRFGISGIPAGRNDLLLTFVDGRKSILESRVTITLDPGTAFDSLVVNMGN
jgi:hypothetical protein